MALDGDSLWIAGIAGLRRYHIPEDKVEKIDNAAIGLLKESTEIDPSGNGTGLAEIGPVVAEVAGQVWFSHGRTQKDAGIFRLRKDGQGWECVIPDTSARCIVEDGDVAWTGTDKGLIRYNTKTGENSLFTAQDGLLSSYVRSLAVDERHIWVGTIYGISMLDRALFETPGAPKVGVSGGDPE
jgi:ligand-binding sensor domain-containing protein